MKGKIEYEFQPTPNWLKDMLIITKISGRQAQILHVITSKTYGTKKTPFTNERKEFAEIGPAYFAKAIDMLAPNVSRELSKLTKRKIILKPYKGKRSVKVNDKVEEWLVADLSKTIIETKTTLSKPICKNIKNDTKSVSNKTLIKDKNLYKESKRPIKGGNQNNQNYNERLNQSQQRTNKRKEDEEGNIEKKKKKIDDDAKILADKMSMDN